MKIRYSLPAFSFHDAYLEKIQIKEGKFFLDFNYGYLYEGKDVFVLDNPSLNLDKIIEDNDFIKDSCEILLYREGQCQEIFLQDLNEKYNFTCMDILFGEGKIVLQGYVTAAKELEDFPMNLSPAWAQCIIELFYYGEMDLLWENSSKL